VTAAKAAALIPDCVGKCGRRPSSPPAHFKMSRWPSNSGEGLQKPRQAATGECALTRDHFSSIGVERYTVMTVSKDLPNRNTGRNTLVLDQFQTANRR